MATFKVGQRVKRTAVDVANVPAGTEGTIVGELREWSTSFFGRPTYKVAFDGRPNPHYGWWTCLPEFLAPLTDPDEWARDKVREITRPQPVLLQGEVA